MMFDDTTMVDDRRRLTYKLTIINRQTRLKKTKGEDCGSASNLGKYHAYMQYADDGF